MKYNITLNEACKLSTYSDQYQYSGGAHGNTVRASINWNLNTGSIIKMENLFYNSQDQQYEIGPYASGIVEFDLPYHNLGLSFPQCLPIL